MVYFQQPDSASHQYGISTPQVTEQIRRVDNTLDYFFRKLETNGLAQKANVIVLSDHGMVQVDQQKNVRLDDIIDSEYYSKCGTSPVFQIIPKAGETRGSYADGLRGGI